MGVGEHSFLEDGFFWEAGPGAIKETDDVASLVTDLGLKDEVQTLLALKDKMWFERR